MIGLCQSALDLEGLHFMRDPTRGGLATVAHEIAQASGQQIRLFEKEITVRDPVQSFCDMLGYDPYYLACEGRVVAAVSPADTDKLLHIWQALPEGRGAALIGQIESGQNRVVLETRLGGERFLEELEDDPLPRIC